MKKLLALILCVMLFVSVIPVSTGALAAGSGKTDPAVAAKLEELRVKAANAKIDADKAAKALKEAPVKEADAKKAYEDTLNDLKHQEDYIAKLERAAQLGDKESAARIEAAKGYLEGYKKDVERTEKAYNDAKAATNKAYLDDKAAQAALKLADAELAYAKDPTAEKKAALEDAQKAAAAAKAAVTPAAAPAAVTLDSIKASIKAAIEAKQDAAKAATDAFEAAKKNFFENSESGILALQNRAVQAIIADYNKQADAAIEGAEKEYTEAIAKLTESIEAEIIKNFPAAASVS